MFSEAERLHVLDAVPVVTVDTRQVRFPDLHQLMRAELSRVRISVVIEISRDRHRDIIHTELHVYTSPVSNLQSGELVRYDAAKCGA